MIASARLDAQVYGRRWNDLTPEGQQRIVTEKRERRLAEQREMQRREAERVTLDEVSETVRRNSAVDLGEVRRRLSRRGTDLSQVEGELVWTKAWQLAPEAAGPELTGGARYHNRRKSGFVSQETLHALGVVYMKLPTTSLERLNELCAERGYCELQREELTSSSGKLENWYREHYNTAEYIAFVLRGFRFFDFRDENHDFVRVHLAEGDLLIIPPGIFHRGTVDQHDDLSLLKCYQADSRTVYRDAVQGQQEVRAQYLASRKRGSVLEDNMFIVPDQH